MALKGLIIQKRHGDKHVKAQFLAKFKKNLVLGVQSHLKFMKISCDSEPHVQNFWQGQKKICRS